MPEPSAQFRRVAILGTGLIGGSFALAIRGELPEARIVGFDRPAVLQHAQSRVVIHESAGDLAGTVRDADLVYIALPISAIVELLPEIAKHASPRALVTDSGSTKRTICRAASRSFTGGALFLGGHPMAGKETPGLDSAGPNLFHGAKYALIREDFAANDPRVVAFVALLQGIGARPVWLDAETHDWAVAIISHLPQMTVIALAEVLGVETGESGLSASLAGPGAHDMLRLAASPYATWRDIAFTNSDNLTRALNSLAQAIDHLRAHLTSRELEQAFAEANRVHKSLSP
jgi:prephenate dehydrogenase